MMMLQPQTYRLCKIKTTDGKEEIDAMFHKWVYDQGAHVLVSVCETADGTMCFPLVKNVRFTDNLVNRMYEIDADMKKRMQETEGE